MTVDLRYILLRSNYVWKERYNYIPFMFVFVTYFLLRRNYAIYLFDVIMFFIDARITFYFGTFILRMEITLQLRFVFVHHCDVFFLRLNYFIDSLDVVSFFDYVRITLYFDSSNYVWKLRYKMVIFSYVCF